MTTTPDILAIQTRELSIGYRDNRVNPLFENLDLSLTRGLLTCFMGPNGIGKSTLIRTLAGLQRPLSGAVNYFVEDRTLAIGNSSITDLAKNVSVVLTDRISTVNMSVYELVSFGRYPYLGWGTVLSNEDRDIIQRSIDYVQIQHLSDTRIFELSDGQLQMAMIARALAQDTPIVLLDEPTAHLDLNNRLEIMNLLRMLARTMNKAILVATHELDLALQTADIIWLAGLDRTIVAGIPEDLVLNGTFDKIFQFKGFDLKTGKIHHEAHRKQTIHIEGSGHNYLWTRNALERCGFSFGGETATHTIIIDSEGTAVEWRVDNSHRFYSIQALIDHLSHQSRN